MVIVDEVRIPVIDPLMIRHVRVRRMDTNTFGDDLIQRPAGADQVIVNLAGAHLVTHQAAVFQPVVERVGLRRDPSGCPSSAILRPNIPSGWLILRLTGRRRQPWCPSSGRDHDDGKDSQLGFQHRRRDRRAKAMPGMAAGHSGDAEQPVRSRVRSRWQPGVSPTRSTIASVASTRDRGDLHHCRHRRAGLFRRWRASHPRAAE